MKKNLIIFCFAFIAFCAFSQKTNAQTLTVTNNTSQTMTLTICSQTFSVAPSTTTVLPSGWCSNVPCTFSLSYPCSSGTIAYSLPNPGCNPPNCGFPHTENYPATVTPFCINFSYTITTDCSNNITIVFN